MAESISIKEVTTKRDLRAWLKVPYTVFKNDPFWVATPDILELEQVSRKHNPFFTSGEAAFFVAYRGSEPVGRISAQINHRYLAQHQDETGHFGFFDCIDDKKVAEALVGAATDWLRHRGMKRMMGPFCLSINEECGLLVSGFETTPSILTRHSRPWIGPLLETCGLNKSMDLFAYRASPATSVPQIDRLARLARETSRIKIRQFDMARYADDVRIVFDIFNDAWRDNWGFVPFSDAEINAMITQTRPIMRGKFGRIVEVDGIPSAMMVALPDLNRALAPFNGRLLPFNWLKLVHAVWSDRWKSARIPLLGIRQNLRRTALAPVILSLLVSEFMQLGRDYDLDWVEFSWVLEINEPMVKLAELAAGPPSKVFRIYEVLV